ncbi:MAG: nucleoside phosphorylase [Bacteroidales bacterium]|nr:nucleoside phosphorylase [Candidatus Cacconaster merdequi]
MDNKILQPIAESELIINDDGSVFHLHLLPEDIADNLVIVGDPGRVDMIAAHFDAIDLVKQNREFRTVTGWYNGVRVTALSHGIGTDNIDIVMTELDALANIDLRTRIPKEQHRRLRILRIGTCGAIQPDIELGSYIFSEVSVGIDGVMNWYSDASRYMLKDFEAAFVEHMSWPERFAKPYFVKSSELFAERFRGWTVKGMTVSAPGFYGPQGRSVRMGLTVPDLVAKFESFRYAGYRVTNIEMESSVLAGMASVLGHDAGTVCLAVANRHRQDINPDYKPLMDKLLVKSMDILFK